MALEQLLRACTGLPLLRPAELAVCDSSQPRSPQGLSSGREPFSYGSLSLRSSRVQHGNTKNRPHCFPRTNGETEVIVDVSVDLAFDRLSTQIVVFDRSLCELSSRRQTAFERRRTRGEFECSVKTHSIGRYMAFFSPFRLSV